MTQTQPLANWSVERFETSAAGAKLWPVYEFGVQATEVEITLTPEQTFQQIIGIGGSFTQASAYVYSKLGKANQERFLTAYFSDEGAAYSLTRTHINSCDFSLYNYYYNTQPKDYELKQFDIAEDKKYIIPLIKAAQKVSSKGFKLMASPWTAPPYMKDNNSFKGGKLLEEYYPTWALYFAKYAKAMAAEGIELWGVTVENEPLGNDNNWESMHYSPAEMNRFVQRHLYPRLKTEGLSLKILGFDQNRDEVIYKWADAMYDSAEISKCYDGMAIHWYASTISAFPEALDYVHRKNPSKHLIQTEACIDAEKPRWKQDVWYWSPEAKDWGYTWAQEKDKHLHPPYVPVYRYARDIIECFNHGVDGWVDWNMLLDKEGGPNWAKNWCVAPVIADVDKDELYFTPLYYTLTQFSRFIHPNATRIGHQSSSADIKVTAVKNTDQSLAVVMLNEGKAKKSIELIVNNERISFTVDAQSINTILLKPR